MRKSFADESYFVSPWIIEIRLVRKTQYIMADMAGLPPGGDVTRAPLLDGVDWSMTSLALLFFVYRLFSRCRIIHKPSLDDFVIIISVISRFGANRFLKA